MEDFDFGILDKSKPKRKETPKVKQIDIDKMVDKRLNKRIDLELKKVKVAKKNLEDDMKRDYATTGDFDRFVDKVRGLLDGYRDNMMDVWMEIYPTLVKMWGTSRGIGLKIARLNTMISDLELENSG